MSLEPGGQLELSGAPLETIHQTCDEVNEHLREVREVADDRRRASSAWAPPRSGRTTTCR
jgi:gamma-glutamylcysteine synthetase